jgi:hypothetical protein
MQNIDRWFLGSAILFGLSGMCLGIDMGIRQDFALTPVHAHLNLVGWASLALYGLAYRTGLVRRDTWATVHYALALAGAIVLPAGIYVAITRDTPAVAIAGSLLTLASLLLFGVNFLRTRPGEI